MTKISGKPQPPAIPATLSSKSLIPSPDLDLQNRPGQRKTTRRRIQNPARVKRTGAPVGKRSRPETPLSRWKISDRGGGDGGGVEEIEKLENKSVPESGRRSSRRGRREKDVVVSARKLAAGLWRLHFPEVGTGGGSSDLRRREDRLGFQPGVGHLEVPILCHRDSKAFGSEPKDLLQSPHSIAGTKNGFLSKCFNSAMEGATKWDPVCLKTSDDLHQIYSQMKLLDQQVSAVSMVSALKAELEQAHVCIQELETERRTSKKKLVHFLRKVGEEKAAWRTREHEKIRAFIDDVRAELNRERKNRQRLEIVNSKLVKELADAKASAKRIMQEYEKERKARELIEEVCDELAKEIGEDKGEAETLKRESLKLREEVEDERRMLQMAEVWREERVQMKLVDAKVAVEERYSQMNKLVADLEIFLMSRSATSDMKEIREALSLREAAAAVNIQDIKEFSYEPPNPDDIFSIFEDVNFGEANERETEPCVTFSPASHASKIHTVSPEVNMNDSNNNQRHSNGFVNHNGDIEEDESGWETVSNIEDQGSSNSPDGSAPSVKYNHRVSNISANGIEWEENKGGRRETPITEISEVCSLPMKHVKKVSSIARLWKSGPNNGENYKIISVEGMKGRLSNERISNGSIISPDRGSGLSPSDIVGQWSSPDSSNRHITRGRKGCIPLSSQKHSLKAKLLEARMESQKVQIRQVLKQKF